ncbi:MAG: hypothetical protein ACSHWZ_05520 [Sulfitobacter sp.]
MLNFKILSVALSGAVALAVPALAEGFRAQNRVHVTPVAGGFQVDGGGGFGARGMWCAAADYARRVEGAPGAARLYVSGPAKQGGQAVFTLDPAGLTPQSVLSTAQSVNTAGANLSVDHALGFCADARVRT